MPGIDHIRQKGKERIVRHRQRGDDRLSKDLQQQCQQQHHQKQEHIQHAHAPGEQVTTVFPDAVDGVQPDDQPVDAAAGRPQRGQSGHRNHSRGCIFIGADDQALHRAHQSSRHDAPQQGDQILHLQRCITQNTQHQKQHREGGQHHKVAGMGCVRRDLIDVGDFHQRPYPVRQALVMRVQPPCVKLFHSPLLLSTMIVPLRTLSAKARRTAVPSQYALSLSFYSAEIR